MTRLQVRRQCAAKLHRGVQSTDRVVGTAGEEHDDAAVRRRPHRRSSEMIVCRTFLAVSFHILGYRRRRSNVKATTYIHWQRWTYKCGCPVQYKYVARVLSPLLPFSSSFRRLAMSFCGCRAGKMARKSRELALHNIQAPKFVGPCVARQPEYSQIQPCSPGVVNGWNTDSSTELFPGCFAPITTQKQGATGQSTFACIVIG